MNMSTMLQRACKLQGNGLLLRHKRSFPKDVPFIFCSYTNRNHSTSSTKEPLVLLSKDSTSNVAILELNSPSSLNALTVEMGLAFQETISDLCRQLNSPTSTKHTSSTSRSDSDQDEEGNEYGNVQALILTGASPSPSASTSTSTKQPKPAFSAGGDISWLHSLRHNPPHINNDIMYSFYKSFLCIRDLPIPTIAAIDGPAIGAGACLAIACDMRIMGLGPRPIPTSAESASSSSTATTPNSSTKKKASTIGFTFSKLGIHAGMGGSHLLPLALGQAQANEILYSGKVMDAFEANRIGLVNHVVYDDYGMDMDQESPNNDQPTNAVMAKSLELARDIATKHPIAVRSMVRSIRLREDNSGETLETTLRREAYAQSMCYASSDWGEGLDALVERREPEFDGFHDY